MARILVLGAGVMGTAITVPLADNGHDIQLVGTHLDTDIIEKIQESRHHPRLRSSVPENVKPFTIQQLDDAFSAIDYVILGVNSLGVEWAAEKLTSYIQPEIPVLFLTKGLNGNGKQLLMLPDIFRQGLPDEISEKIQIAAVGGPSIAGELSARRPTSVVITGGDSGLLNTLKNLLQTTYYHVSMSTDIAGVEISVGLKNLYAIGVGIVQGMHENEDDQLDLNTMHNLAAALFTQSLVETAYMVEIMGGQRDTVYSLAGVGDLFVTCQGGRNNRVGRYLGLGHTYAEACSRLLPGETIEGAEIAFAIRETIHELITMGELESEKLPLLNVLLETVCDQIPGSLAIEGYFYSSYS